MNLFLPDILNRLSIVREKYERDFRVCDVEDLDAKSQSGNFTMEAFKRHHGRQVRE